MRPELVSTASAPFLSIVPCIPAPLGLVLSPRSPRDEPALEFERFVPAHPQRSMSRSASRAVAPAARALATPSSSSSLRVGAAQQAARLSSTVSLPSSASSAATRRDALLRYGLRAYATEAGNEMTCREALNKAMEEEMLLDDRVFIMGEEVAQYNVRSRAPSVDADRAGCLQVRRALRFARHNAEIAQSHQGTAGQVRRQAGHRRACSSCAASR